MRIILDTNIIVSGLISEQGAPAQLLPDDNFLLAMAEAGAADYLVTGDKRHVLALQSHGNTAVITAREMLPLLGITK